MYKDIHYTDYSKEFINQLTKGAFLNVKSKDSINTMTIGWGNIGFIWGKPILAVMVRYSRHTYQLIEKSTEFTVSLPLKGQLKKELGFCGSQSGKDFNKFKECNLTPKNGKVIETPIIDECDLHYECKIVHKQAMEPGLLDGKINEKYYSNHDYHVIYYGEIVATYIKED